MILKNGYVLKTYNNWADHQFPPAGECHDCGTPSCTYRCERCKAIFMEKYSCLGSDPDNSYGDLREIFKEIRRNRQLEGMRK